MDLEIVRMESTDSDIIAYEVERLERYYKIMLLIGAVLFAFGIIV